MWLNVPGFEFVQAHSNGRIRVTQHSYITSNKHGAYERHYPTTELTIYDKGIRYPIVKLPSHANKTGRQLTMQVHRLVALAHKGEPLTPRSQVRHKDGDTRNCKASNLLWGTALENRQDAVRHGTDMRGESHHKTTLSATDVENIRLSYVAKSKTCGAVALAKEYGVHRTTIENIINGRTWK